MISPLENCASAPSSRASVGAMSGVVRGIVEIKPERIPGPMARHSI